MARPMKVRFTADFDYTPTARRQVTFAYKAGPDTITVKRECGEQAVAAGKAIEVLTETTPEAPSHDGDAPRPHSV